MCCSGGVWGLWGRGGGFQQRGSALVEYRIRQIIPIGWVDMFIITPTLPVCRGWAVCVAWEGAGGVGGQAPRAGCGHEAALRFGQLACLGWGGRRRCCGVYGSSSGPRVVSTCGEEGAGVRIGQVRVGQVAIAWKVCRDKT